jgi:hypothetical protein
MTMSQFPPKLRHPALDGRELPETAVQNVNTQVAGSIAG